MPRSSQHNQPLLRRGYPATSVRCRRMKNKKAPVLAGAFGFSGLRCLPWSGWLLSAFAHLSKPVNRDFVYRIGPALNRTVGNLAGRIEKFGLLNVNWLFAIERTFFAVGIELVVSAVGLHHKTHQFVSRRTLCSVE